MIDTNPAPGRFILSEPYGFDSLVGRVSKIVRVAGQRVICKTEGMSREVHFYKWTFCCDTQEEVDQILAINAALQARINEARHSARLALDKLLKEANK